MSATSRASVSPRIRSASWAVFAVFALAGFLFASWVSRLPAVRDSLGLTPGTIGLVLLVASIGSVGALPLAGPIAERLGTRATTLLGVGLAVLGYLGVVGAFVLGSVPLIAAGLFLANMGVATWDVAMNLEGALVEQGLRRAIMPIYHAGFSLGTVLGAGLGALASNLGIPFQVHLPVACALVVLAALVAVRRFLTPGGAAPAGAAVIADGGARVDGEAAVSAPSGGSQGSVRRANPFAAWTEPRTLLIGLLVLSAALTEGSANDWLSLASIEAFDFTNAQGATMLTVFLVAMTAMRFGGTVLLDRFGRVLVLRLCIGLAIIGLVLFGLAPNAAIGAVGAVAWGLGAALGFPVGMSAASDEPARAAARLSVVATIGYTAFLAGPPVLGMIADHVGYRGALLFILIPLTISLFVTKVAAPPAGSAGIADDPVDAPVDTPVDAPADAPASHEPHDARR